MTKMTKQTVKLIDRFLDKVDVEAGREGCMTWTGAVSSSGYGEITVDGRPEGAHRMSYRLFVGDVPKGMCVCHMCDNPLCVTPSHLWLGSHEDNARDMVQKGRSARGSKQHRAKLTESKVAEIIALLGLYTQTEIAQMYGVSQRCVSYIATGTTWTHVGSEVAA